MFFCLIGCNEEIKEIEDLPCTHEQTKWVWEEDARCNRNNWMYEICDECGEIVSSKEEFKEHETVEETKAASCTEKGETIITCKNCSYNTKKVIAALGHDYQYVIDDEATKTSYGLKHRECTRCHDKESSFAYVNNDFTTHGALHVDGVDLMDSHNEKFRLVGLSTFGLQWQGEYVNYSTIENMKNAFGANIIRFAFYTAEGGYCTANAATKEKLYQTLVNGIHYATELGLYVIVDWHMLGADENYEGDSNPLFFMKESKEFFDKVTKEFSDYDNLLFEIMNEPSDCTWKDCKQYAEEVIPVIRKNMPNAVILVGNPQWSSDLASVASNPLTGYTNIMYTFHFYANDNCMTDKIVTAVKTKKLPVFITEHGGMDASGYGEINYTSLASWYKVLDQYNISFVAWSIANLDSSSCIFVTGSKKIDDFSDENLKEWGIYYKQRVRTVMGLPL